MARFAVYDAPDVWHGLAAEEALLDDASLTAPHVLLWRCPPAVVWGKHQVPQREADLAWCRGQGIDLARRASGGGTVVHDAGSWSLAVILPRTQYATCAIYGLFQQWISGLVKGVSCRGGEGIFLRDKKVSGHAYCYRKDRVLHHGTLLVDSDLDRLRRALKTPALQLTTHAVASNPAPVANLSDWGARPENVSAAAAAAVDKEFGRCDPFTVDAPAELVVQIQEWDRVFGGTPRFTTDMNGGTWVVRHGRVETITREGDPNDETTYERGRGPRFVHEDLFASGEAPELTGHPSLFPPL